MKKKKKLEKEVISDDLYSLLDEKSPLEDTSMNISVDDFKEKVDEKVAKKPTETKIIQPKEEKFKKFITNFKLFLLKCKNNEDYKIFFGFFMYSVLIGLVVNFAVFCVFGFRFTWYSWLGWGMFIWLVKHEIVRIIRGIFIR